MTRKEEVIAALVDAALTSKRIIWRGSAMPNVGYIHVKKERFGTTLPIAMLQSTDLSTPRFYIEDISVREAIELVEKYFYCSLLGKMSS